MWEFTQRNINPENLVEQFWWKLWQEILKMFWIVNKKFLGKLYISLLVPLCADVLISSNSYLLWLAS